MNSDGKVTVAPHSKCKVIVNGVPVTNRTKLQHLVGSWSGHSSASVIPQDGGGGEEGNGSLVKWLLSQ